MTHTRLEITEESQVGEARRLATQLGLAAKLDDEANGRLGIIVTELATNIVKHGNGGEILARLIEDGTRTGIEVLALDSGKGMDVAASARDGFSTSGTAGQGLGAIGRLSQEFEAYSSASRGTVLLARVWTSASSPNRNGTMRVGGICVAKPGEELSGDAWDFVANRELCTVLVVDGLGHGAFAAEAAREAVGIFRKNVTRRPGELIELIHAGLRATRGAAVAVALVDTVKKLVRFAGLGNVAASIVSGNAVRHLVSHHGTAGHDARRIGEFQYPWPGDGWLIMSSDGLGTHWDLDAYAGLEARQPTLAAAVLYRDHRRGRDDTTVVIAREDA